MLPNTEPPKDVRTPEQIAAAQKAAAEKLKAGEVTTPIPKNIVAQPAESRADSEVQLQSSGRKNIPLPESETRVSNPAKAEIPVQGKEPEKDLDVILRKKKFSENQQKALNNIAKVRQEAGKKVGKRGCNPFLFNKEVLIPLENLVEEGDADAIAYAMTMTCPEQPGSNEKPGPLLVSQKDLIRKKQALEQARTGI